MVEADSAGLRLSWLVGVGLDFGRKNRLGWAVSVAFGVVGAVGRGGEDGDGERSATVGRRLGVVALRTALGVGWMVGH